LAELAGRQHGVVSARQLRELEFDRSTIARRVEAGFLHPLHRAVYAVGHISVSLRGRYLAAVLACGPGAALSHRSAADLWGLRPSTGRIEVTVSRKGVGLPGLVVHRSRLTDPSDFTVVDSIRTTTVARTLLDLAGAVSPKDLAAAVDRAERMEVFDLLAIEDLLRRVTGRRGTDALKRAIMAWRPGHTRSELEDRYKELVRAAALPTPLCNVLLTGESGTHEVDAFWPLHRLVIQLDGFAYHRTRRDRERDASVDADLELGGYRIVHLTWDDVVVHPKRTVRRLARALRPQPVAPVEEAVVEREQGEGRRRQ
jgi:very-short-patch-repair endonuclease